LSLVFADLSRDLLLGLSLVLPFAAGCGGAASDGAAAIRFDPCEPVGLTLEVGVTAGQQAGVQAAISAWDATAGARLLLGDGSSGDGSSVAALPVIFQRAAALSHGFFDPARGEIFINDDLSGDALAVVIAHEVGHAMGLVHVTGRASVMNPSNVDVAPNAGDAADLSALWGACGSEDASSDGVSELGEHASPAE
jgi:hypothetical protein